MKEAQGSSEIKKNNEINKRVSLLVSFLPIVVLMSLLAYNIFFVESQEWFGAYTNQYILLFSGLVAVFVGAFYKVSLTKMITEVWVNWKSVFVPILILLLVGALSGSWLISGIIPAMVYYGLQILSPEIFLPASVIIAAVISIATGSSWTTTATVGIALVSIGTVLGIPSGMIAGAVISGAYFGDKMSPLSDTTNLAPAMAGTDLFTHIKYMAFTTVPTIVVTLIIFTILSTTIHVTGTTDITFILETINKYFNITPWLFLVPVAVVLMILLKVKPLIALITGVGVAAIFSVIFQSKTLATIANSKGTVVTNALLTSTDIVIDDSSYLAVFSKNDIEKITQHKQLKKVFTDDDLKGVYTIDTLKDFFKSDGLDEGIITNKARNLDKLITIKRLKKLFSSGGMEGMIWTILLIICAMVFGGIMDAIGALAKITESLLKLASSVFGLFASTVVSCLGLNIIASDQYLAIVIPGKMFKKAYEDKKLAPENLSRTLEDAGTVTSVLIPWNTCGAYQSSVLGVSVADYFIYAFFNYLSPVVTLLFAAFNLKIRQLVKKDKQF